MDKIKLAYIGDSPFINSGFGVVARSVLSRFPKDRIELHVLGAMYQHMPEVGDFEKIPSLIRYEPVCVHDMLGLKSTPGFINDVGPDALFIISDPGTIRLRLDGIMLSGRQGKLPTTTYFPIEGLPMSPHIVAQAAMVKKPITWTRFGANALKENGVLHIDYVGFGTNHGDFRPYDDALRREVRLRAGIDDKFVVGMIGVNKRTNRYPTVLEAAKILKDMGHKDIIFYLHCQEFGEIAMGGWDLSWMVKSFDVEDMVIIKPNQKEHKYIGRPIDTVDGVLSMNIPKDMSEAIENIARFDFVSLINMFDVYLDPASAHGWNLPASEAAACGVPVITVDDGFARSEIFGGCAYMMQPTAVDYWHTGAALPLVSAQDIANAILDMKDNDALRVRVSNLCHRKFSSLKWEDAADKIYRAIVKSVMV